MTGPFATLTFERPIAAPVATNAITIPMIPYQFPRRAVSCRESPPRLKINNALAAMYAIVISDCCIKINLIRSDCESRSDQMNLAVGFNPRNT